MNLNFSSVFKFLAVSLLVNWERIQTQYLKKTWRFLFESKNFYSLSSWTLQIEIIREQLTKRILFFSFSIFCSLFFTFICFLSCSHNSRFPFFFLESFFPFFEFPIHFSLISCSLLFILFLFVLNQLIFDVNISKQCKFSNSSMKSYQKQHLSHKKQYEMFQFPLSNHLLPICPFVSQRFWILKFGFWNLFSSGSLSTFVFIQNLHKLLLLNFSEFPTESNNVKRQRSSWKKSCNAFLNTFKCTCLWTQTRTQNNSVFGLRISCSGPPINWLKFALFWKYTVLNMFA